MGSWLSLLTSLSFLWLVNSDPKTAILFWEDHHQGAQLSRSRMVDQTGSELLIESGIHLFGKNRCDGVRR